MPETYTEKSAAHHSKSKTLHIQPSVNLETSIRIHAAQLGQCRGNLAGRNWGGWRKWWSLLLATAMTVLRGPVNGHALGQRVLSRCDRDRLAMYAGIGRVFIPNHHHRTTIVLDSFILQKCGTRYICLSPLNFIQATASRCDRTAHRRLSPLQHEPLKRNRNTASSLGTSYTERQEARNH